MSGAYVAMSKLSLIIAVAIGLAFWGEQLQAQQSIQRPQENTSEQQEQSSPLMLPSPFPVIVVEGEDTANSRARSERESEEREKEDLIAQQRMADATEAMNEATQSMKYAAWLSFFAVAIGTGLLIWTLWLTQQANQAARAAVAVTRDIGKRQVRAYLTLESGGVRDIVAGYPPTVSLVFSNRGQSPANKVRIRSWTAITSGSPDDLKVRFDSECINSAGEMGPSASAHKEHVHHVPLTKQNIDDLKAERATFVVAVVVRYRDAFGDDRRLIAKLFADNIDFGTSRALLSPTGRNNRSN